MGKNQILVNLQFLLTGFLVILSWMFCLFVPKSVLALDPLSDLTPVSKLLPSDTTSVTLSLNTELNANCRWSETASTPYVNMTNDFTTGQGTTSHSTDIGGWTVITKRTFYIRCDDVPPVRDPDAFELSTSLRKMGTFDSGYPKIYSQNGAWDASLGTEYYAGLNIWLSWWSNSTYQSRANAVRAINPKTKVLMTQDATYGASSHEWDTVYDTWLNAIPTDPGYPCMFRNTSGTILTNGTYGNPMYNMTNAYCVTQLVNQNINYWNGSNLAFDGIFWDMMGTTITGTIGPDIDADLDEVADDPATLNAAYQAGIESFLTQVRAGIPNAILIGNDSPASYGEWENGRYIESQVRNYLDNYYPKPWTDIVRDYKYWISNGQQNPVTVNLDNHAYMYLPQKYGPQIPNMPTAMKTEASSEYRRVRFGLATALMGNGLSSYDMGPFYYGFNWWYDEYGTAKDYTTTGYLGQPTAEAALAVDSLSTTDDITNGSFDGGTSNWNLSATGASVDPLVVDPTGGINNGPGAHISIPAGNPPGDGSHYILFYQNNLTIEVGKYYTLSFWAKVDSTRKLSDIRVQRQVSPWEYDTTTDSVYKYGTANLTTDWQHFYLTYRGTVANANQGRLTIGLGTTEGDIYIDEIKFQEGTIGVWSRPFDNGRVFVNIAPEVKIIDLASIYGRNYKKINGTQAPLYYTRIDDDDSTTLINGSWTETPSTSSSNPNQFGDTFQTIAGSSPSSTVTYSPSIAYAGDYNVYAWVVPSGGNSSGVTVTLNHAGGSNNVNLDETTGSVGWHSLGTFTYDTTSDSTVVISATGTGTVVADAIKLETTARYNDGSEVSSITLQPDDAIVMLNETSAPTVTIDQAAGQSDPTATSPINFTVVFSESVSDFATGDVDLSGTAGATTAVVTGSGTTYNVEVSGMTGSGTVIATIATDKAHDVTGNNNEASTSTDNSVTYDITGPILTSISIIDTSGYTNDATPVINISSSGSPTHAAFSCNGGTNWSDWIAYADTISSFDITSGATGCSSTNGSKTITAKLKDVLNNESSTADDSTYYDNTGPSGSITNSSGDPTTDTTPTLDLTIADSGVGTTDAQMQFSCNNTDWSSLENYLTPKGDFNIKPAVTTYGCNTTDGTRTVYVRYRDTLGNTGSSYNTGSFTLDTTGPTLTSISLSDTGGYTNDSTPDIVIVSSESPTEVAFSCNGGTNWSDWIAYADTISSFDITSGATGCSSTNGSKTITAKLKDVLNNESSTADDSTYYDNTGPTGTVSNGSGDPTSDTTPTLNLSMADSGVGVAGAEMRLSCNETDWSAWESYATPKTDFDIKPGVITYGCATTDGSRTVYVQFRDSLLNTGSSYNTGSFTLNTVEPTPTPTPTGTPAPSTPTPTNIPSTSTGFAEAEAPKCTDTPPGTQAPNLVNATAQSSSAILIYFNEASDPVTNYVLEYGIKSGEYIYSSTNIGAKGTKTYLVELLSPDTTYYFRIRASNNCATGPWSNEISGKTKPKYVLNNSETVTSKLPVVNYQTPTPIPTSTLIPINIGDKQNEELQPPIPTGYNVKISVVDIANKPVEGVKITIHSTPQEALTDKFGVAEFQNVEPGSHQVLITYNDYQGEQSIDLKGDVKQFNLNITIQQKGLSLPKLSYAIIGIMGLIIVVLTLWIVRGKRKNTHDFKPSDSL